MTKRGKSAAVLLSVLMLVALLSGCGSMQIAQRDIVDAVAIDYDPDRGFTVCAAVFKITGAQEETEYILLRETAQTLNGAFSALASHTSASLMFENNTVIFLGAQTYRQQYAQVIGYLVHSYPGNIRTQVIGVTGRAGEAVEKIAGQGSSFAQLVADLADRKIQRNICSNELSQCAPNPDGSIPGGFLPVVELREFPQPGSNEPQAELTLSALAAINSAGWAETFSGELMQGVLILQNRAKRIPVQIQLGDSLLEAELHSPHVRIFRDGQAENVLLVRCSVDFVLTNGVSQLSDAQVRAVQAQCAQRMTALLEKTAALCRRLYGVDPLNLAHYAYLCGGGQQGGALTLRFETDIQ